MQKINILKNIALDVERKKLNLYLKFKDDVRVKLNDVRIIIVYFFFFFSFTHLINLSKFSVNKETTKIF